MDPSQVKCSDIASVSGSPLIGALTETGKQTKVSHIDDNDRIIGLKWVRAQ